MENEIQNVELVECDYTDESLSNGVKIGIGVAIAALAAGGALLIKKKLGKRKLKKELIAQANKDIKEASTNCLVEKIETVDDLESESSK